MRDVVTWPRVISATCREESEGQRHRRNRPRRDRKENRWKPSLSPGQPTRCEWCPCDKVRIARSTPAFCSILEFLINSTSFGPSTVAATTSRGWRMGPICHGDGLESQISQLDVLARFGTRGDSLHDVCFPPALSCGRCEISANTDRFGGF